MTLRRTVALHRGPRKDPIERFWSHVDKTADCWLWTGYVDEWGYGRFQGGILGTRATRVSWRIHFGPIPEGLIVCHHCDTPACVRPDHLFVGTSADNARDRDLKGRHGWAVGERQGLAKLTADGVRYIRSALAAGKAHAALGRELGVSANTVADVRRGRTWRHV